MEELRYVDIVGYAIQVLNQPSVRAATTLVSVLLALISFSLSIWAVRKTAEAMATHSSSLRSEQARFVESRWMAIEENILAHPESARLFAEMFEIDGEVEARRRAFRFMFLSTLAIAFHARKQETIDREDYDAHMRYFFSQYKGSADYVLYLVKESYSADFLSECERCLALVGNASSKSSGASFQRPKTDGSAEAQFSSLVGRSA